MTDPKTIGRYQIVERIGAGGMGEVYLAELVGAGGFRRRCAVKTTLPHRSTREEVETMFQREAVLAARIAHENVVQVFDFGKDGDLLYLVMEYVDGLTLRSLLEKRRKSKKELRIDEACALVLDVAKGLDAIHHVKAVHRDVTPDNVLVTREGVAKIGDFGIAVAADMARLTMTGELKGKIPYMAPEQLDGADVTSAADVFALGVTFTWLLCGKRPFDRATELGTMNAIVREEPPRLRALRPDVPVDVERLLASMLSKRADDRPSAKQIVDALANVSGARTRPKALVEELLGPQTRDLPPPLETVVMSMPLAPTSITSAPTQIAQAPVTISGPDVVALPSSGDASEDASEDHPTTQRRVFVTAVTTEHARPPRDRRPLVAAVAAVAVIAGAAAAFVFARANDDERAAKPTTSPVNAFIAHEATLSHEEMRPSVDAGTAHLVPHEDVGVAVEADTIEIDAGPIAPEPVDAAKPEPTIELRAPSSIAWFSVDGHKLGSGTVHTKSRAHTVIAVDGNTGAHCTVAVQNGVGRWDSIGTGALDVRANPYAHVFVGNKDLGITPLKPLPQLPACTIRVKLVYEKATRTEVVRVAANKTNSVRVEFE